MNTEGVNPFGRENRRDKIKEAGSRRRMAIVPDVEEPLFDPHSAPSVDTSGVSRIEKARARMQGEMNALGRAPESVTTPAETETEYPDTSGYEVVESEITPEYTHLVRVARIQKLREHLKTLEKQAQDPAEYHRKHDELEDEVLAVEAELR